MKMGSYPFLSNNYRQAGRLLLAMLVAGFFIFAWSLPSEAKSTFNPAQKRKIKVPAKRGRTAAEN